MFFTKKLSISIQYNTIQYHTKYIGNGGDNECAFTFHILNAFLGLQHELQTFRCSPVFRHAHRGRVLRKLRESKSRQQSRRRKLTQAIRRERGANRGN